MKTNKILVASIVGGIAFFFLGWLIYGMILSGYMAENTNSCAMRPMGEMVWWSMIASNIIQALFLALVFSWASIASVGEGIRKGALIGGVVSAAVNLNFYAVTDMYSNLAMLIVDVAAFTVMAAIAGGVVAWVLTMKKS